MSMASSVQNATRAVVAQFPYTCSLVPLTEGGDSSGGMTLTPATATATGVKINFEMLRYPIRKMVGGKEAAVLTHKLFLEATAAALAVNVNYEIRVDAHGSEAARTFIDAEPLEGSWTGIVQMAASVKNA